VKKSVQSRLDQGVIKSLIKNNVDVYVFEEIDSTSQWVVERLSAGSVCTVLCVAETQKKGRGRSGRLWQSPAYSNIYMSFSYLADIELKNIAATSLVVGLAITRVFKNLGISGVTLKWPNDILLRGKKLAGVLIEAKTVGQQLYLVVGIGINVRNPEGFNVDSELGWEDLSAEGLGLADRSRIIAMVYDECEKLMSSFVANGFAMLKKEWEAVDEYAGKDVVVMDQNTVIATGMGSGVDDYGCLLIKKDNTVKKVVCGDVSLRKSHEE